jgi:hypothetical protein
MALGKRGVIVRITHIPSGNCFETSVKVIYTSFHLLPIGGPYH